MQFLFALVPNIETSLQVKQILYWILHLIFESTQPLLVILKVNCLLSIMRLTKVMLLSLF